MRTSCFLTNPPQDWINRGCIFRPIDSDPAQCTGPLVFLVTHDLDTLYTICDRVAVLANQKVLINDGIEAVERFKHPWIQEYFHGPVAVRPQATGASSQETQP